MLKEASEHYIDALNFMTMKTPFVLCSVCWNAVLFLNITFNWGKVGLQISRMLRLNGRDMQAVTAFQESHEEARKVNFGRLLRSPTVWEDLVKCILLCNCGWEHKPIFFLPFRSYIFYISVRLQCLPVLSGLVLQFEEHALVLDVKPTFKMQ